MPLDRRPTRDLEAPEWETPDETYDPLNAIWKFTLDGAASALNAKVPRYCTEDGVYQRHTIGHELSPGEHGMERETHVSRVDDRDGLQYPWADERVFLNPPWNEREDVCAEPCRRKTCRKRGWHRDRPLAGISDFMRKVRGEVLHHRATVVAVLPSRTATWWFHEVVLPYAWRPPMFLRKRIAFDDPLAAERAEAGLPARTGPPEGSMIVIWR